MARFVVAIDGGAGTGKSTTAKGVARRLNFFYLDTGAMYRAVTLKYLQNSSRLEPIDMAVIKKIIAETEIDLRQEGDQNHVYLDKKDVTLEIRTQAVNRAVSPVSAVPEVREWMVAKQREVAEGKNVVCEGRDIGTVVFPDAQVKVFLTADLETRAQRRLLELKTKGIDADYEDVIENLKFRDRYDSSRTHSPLKKASDAVVVDTTDLTIEEEISVVEKLVRERLDAG
ncbi:MAG TPA: (d)CMP kinase [candidate division WOR-3 bacterium]|uniref:Cytidylate kinase n=1 Tax=candidate division WOR-3 bacterium TaxID=2052148 RepID=A0A9C9K0A2_UNCW3|nr:(d)CMP kinase [candidate division WOR-3 bacterium]